MVALVVRRELVGAARQLAASAARRLAVGERLFTKIRIWKLR
ncbi:unnamed protein product [Toxocara canis]|uniref:Uncharacterized protein n=1 Tax=Toxocara canis TaxID=6265 RepID=A0A3P7H845_TOXCA|nr:unnamed protein product [Toxocara canis]